MAQRPCQKYGSDNYTTALQSWNKTIQTHCEGSLLSSSKSVSLLSSAWFHSLHIKAKRIILVLSLNSHFWTRRSTFLLLNNYNTLFTRMAHPAEERPWRNERRKGKQRAETMGFHQSLANPFKHSKWEEA